MGKFFSAVFAFLAACFGILGFVGTIFIVSGYIVILWEFQSQSFWSFINPLTHIKIALKLLSDLDIYIVALCWGVFYGLIFLTGKFSEKEENKIGENTEKNLKTKE